MTDLVDSTRLVEQLGDERASELFARLDRLARELLPEHGGREIDKTDGFLILFDRPVDAAMYALAYHAGLAKLGEETGARLAARAGIFLGEVFLHENSPEDVARGAKPLEVEGLAKPMASRIMNLAVGGQTLLNQGAFDLARRAIVGKVVPEGTAWVAHGPYLLKGCDDPVQIFEIGIEHRSPLVAPADTPGARRSVAAGDEEMLGWRPAVTLPVPGRRGWILDRKLGEGGFGEVWLALNRRTGTNRVFKFCFDADRLRSFKRELTLFRLLRDALGDRDDIARLYEVQLEEAPYYLETSFTEGGSLVDWSEEQGGLAGIPLEIRLDLVSRTARAVAAAHSVGVLHKDIKPGNILIYTDQGEPRPRLADFGIGLLTDRGQLEGRNITVAGFTRAVSDLDSLTGTPMYTPPEALIGRPATVRGDVFALGVLLYQMVVGDLERPLGEGWERDIEDPLLREDIASCVQGAEEDRLADAALIADRLEQLPERRRARRWQKRRRVAAIAASIMLVLFAFGSALGVREIAQRRAVERQRDKAEAVAEFLADVIAKGSSEVSNDHELTLADLIDAYEPEMERRFADQPEVRIALLTTLARARKELGEYEDALRNIEEAVALVRTHHRARDVDAGRTLHEYGAILWMRTEYAAAERAYGEALEIRESLARRRPADAEAAFALAETMNHLAACSWKSGDMERARSGYERALSLYTKLLSADDIELGKLHNNIGAFCIDDQRFADAEMHLTTAIRIFEAQGAESFVVAAAKNNLGRVYRRTARPEEARELFDEALAVKIEIFGPDHRRVAISHLNLGSLLIDLKRPSDAQRHADEAARILALNDDPKLDEARQLQQRCREQIAKQASD